MNTRRGATGGEGWGALAPRRGILVFFVGDGLGHWPHGNVSYKSWKWRIWKSYVTQLMPVISLHCIAVTESLSYCVHYSRSTTSGIFMARSHTTAIFWSCQFVIFDSRPIYFWTLGLFGIGPTSGGIAEAPRVCGGLKFAKCGPIFGDFRPFSTVFRQNGGQNYFRFRFSLQNRIPNGGLYRRRHNIK